MHLFDQKPIISEVLQMEYDAYHLIFQLEFRGFPCKMVYGKHLRVAGYRDKSMNSALR